MLRDVPPADAVTVGVMRVHVAVAPHHPHSGCWMQPQISVASHESVSSPMSTHGRLTLRVGSGRHESFTSRHARMPRTASTALRSRTAGSLHNAPGKRASGRSIQAPAVPFVPSPAAICAVMAPKVTFRSMSLLQRFAVPLKQVCGTAWAHNTLAHARQHDKEARVMCTGAKMFTDDRKQSASKVL